MKKKAKRWQKRNKWRPITGYTKRNKKKRVKRQLEGTGTPVDMCAVGAPLIAVLTPIITPIVTSITGGASSAASASAGSNVGLRSPMVQTGRVGLGADFLLLIAKNKIIFCKHSFVKIQGTVLTLVQINKSWKLDIEVFSCMTNFNQQLRMSR